VTGLAHIPGPPESAWIGEWQPFAGECGHHSWVRHFAGRRWTVDTTLQDPLEVELVGAQFSDGSTEMRVCLEGVLHLDPGEALMLSTTLSRAAEELVRVQGGGP
jgi:hypothetical protein